MKARKNCTSVKKNGDSGGASLRGGWPRFPAAGAGFIFTAALIVWLLAVAYSNYGALPGIQPWLAGLLSG